MRTQRERTIRNHNLHLCATWECDGDGWPLIHPSHAVPDRLATFCVADSVRDADAFCHFLIDDKGAIAPDFSTYTDMPYPIQQYNTYRSRALQLYWQDMGIEVVPTLNWSDERSLGFTTAGCPKGGTYAVCTTGRLRTRGSALDFSVMLSKACDIVRPDTLLVYGPRGDLGIDPSIGVVWYANDNHERVVRNAGHGDKVRGDH